MPSSRPRASPALAELLHGKPAMRDRLARGVTLVGIAAFAVACHKAASTSAGAGDAAPPTAAAPASPTAPANALPYPSASVAGVVNPETLPRYEGPTGSVEGTVL